MAQQASGPTASILTAGRRWSAVLFDLDGTLLDIDGEGFLDAYVEALTAWWRPAEAGAFRQTVMAAAVPIFSRHPGRTNGEVFREHLGRHLDLGPEEIAARLSRFHTEALVGLRGTARALPDARACVSHCLALGLRIAVATTPIYMPEVIATRLQWAGLADLPWDLVTHSERMQTCKPHPAYFSEVAAHLDVDPRACVMVGDDPLQDGPAGQIGMGVLLRATEGGAGWSRLSEVAEAMTHAAEAMPERGRPLKEGAR